jgi:hypothetical protein
MRPHVKAGNRYRMEEGEIEVDAVLPISLVDITPALARASGFKGVVDLLKVAKHGKGESVYLVRFHYVPPGIKGAAQGMTRQVRVAAQGRANKPKRRTSG